MLHLDVTIYKWTSRRNISANGSVASACVDNSNCPIGRYNSVLWKSYLAVSFSISYPLLDLELEGACLGVQSP